MFLFKKHGLTFFKLFARIWCDEKGKRQNKKNTNNNEENKRFNH